MNNEQIIHDEKYISIPYDLWFNKYKKLEEENEHLKRDRDSRTVYLRYNRMSNGDDNYGSVGYIDTSATFLLSNRDIILSEVKRLINREANAWSGDYGEVKAYEANLKDQHRQLNEKAVSINDKIKSLPLIVRWLFNIK